MNKAKVNQRSVTKPDIELGKRIRLRRVDLKISQAELGAELGVSFQQIQKYEKGSNRVGAARLAQIATVLKCPVSFFYGERTKNELEIESLMFTDAPFATRLIKAWAAVDQSVQRHVVSLLETLVAQKA